MWIGPGFRCSDAYLFIQFLRSPHLTKCLHVNYSAENAWVLGKVVSITCTGFPHNCVNITHHSWIHYRYTHNH